MIIEDLKLILGSIKSNKKTASQITFISILSGLFESIGVITLVPILNYLFSQDSSYSDKLSEKISILFNFLKINPTLTNFLLFFIFAIFCKTLLMTFSSIIAGNAWSKVANDKRMDLIENISRSKWSYFINLKSGSLINSLTRETEKWGSYFIGITYLITGLVHAVIYFAIAIYISPLLSFICFSIAMIFMLIFSKLINVARTSGNFQQKAVDDLASNYQQLLNLFKPLKAMNLEEKLKHLFVDNIKQIYFFRKKEVIASALLKNTYEIVAALFICLIIIVYSKLSDFSLSGLIVFIIALQRILANTNMVQLRFQGLVANSMYVKNLNKHIDFAKKEKEFTGGNKNYYPKNKIILKNLSFNYSKNNKKIFDKINIEFKLKHFSSIEGKSGAGKTTLVDLILGLRRPDKGEIYLDNLPYNKIRINNWRKKVGYVPQEPILLNDTIKNNVTLGQNFSNKDVLKALNGADFLTSINNLPNGLETKVGEKGTFLSVGERQRISIARALIRKPILIILDESTSSLDKKTEENIIKTFKKLKKSVAFISISHRGKISQISDKTYYISNGKIKSK